MIRQHRLGKEGEPRPPTGSGSRWKQGLEWEAACIGLVNGNGTAANGTFNRGPENRNLVAVEYFSGGLSAHIYCFFLDLNTMFEQQV